MNYLSNKYNEVGFGISKEDADADSYLNMCRKDIKKDVQRKFIKRREEVNPWFPLPNILQIPSVGCLVYKEPFIIEQKSGRQMVVDRFEESIFYYILSLTEGMLSYEDIMVSFREEIDIFFSNISDQFESLKDYPAIKCIDSDNGFSPKAIYTFEGGLLVGVSSDYVGIKVMGDDWYYAVDIANHDIIPIIYYLASRAGIVLSGEGEVSSVLD